MKRIVWVGGWGISPDWFASEVEAHLPNWRHRVLPPTPEIPAGGWWDEDDWLGGYSLGAFLLLKMNRQQAIANPAVLLAPFFAYPSEENLGGRVRSAQIHYLARWMKRDAPGALRDFYERAGIPASGRRDELPYSADALQWGVSILAEETIAPNIPAHWQAACGARDPLLDPVRINQLAPAVQIAPGAGHDPGSILKAMGEPPWSNQ